MSLVVAALFVSASLRIDLAMPIAVAFVIALLSLAAALLLFLREVFPRDQHAHVRRYAAFYGPRGRMSTVSLNPRRQTRTGRT